MKKTWECSQVEVVHSSISVEENNQLLDEWGEVIYHYLCQLSEKNSVVPESLTKRTGTDN